MDTLNKIVSYQNHILLKKIADSKFNNSNDVNNFIEKYHKYNYHMLKVSKNDKLLEYSFNRIINIQNAFNL